MQLGSSLSSVVNPGQTEREVRDVYDGERFNPRTYSSSALKTSPTHTPLAPPSPWQQFRPFGRKARSAPNSPPMLSEENEEIQESRRPKGKRRVSDPGARNQRDFEGLRSKVSPRSQFAGFTAYFSGSPRSSPQMDTMSRVPLLHTLDEDEDEEELVATQSGQSADGLGIMLFSPPSSHAQDTGQGSVGGVSPACSLPLPKRISFSPSPNHYVTIPDVVQAHDSLGHHQYSRAPSMDEPSVRTSPRQPSDRASPRSPLSPRLVDTHEQIGRSPILTSSYNDAFSCILSPGSKTVFCAATQSPALSTWSDDYNEEFGSVELSDTKGTIYKVEPTVASSSRATAPQTNFTEQERTVRHWSSQSSGSWGQRCGGYFNSKKQEHSAWPGARNNGVLSV
jgi:hypothetical protein